jgi:RNA polymerase sigma-70 factor (ECF subfamily)
VTRGSHALAASEAALDRLVVRSGASRWGVPRAALIEAVGRAVSTRFAAATPAAGVMDAFVDGLHAEDLALACACACGSPEAWDHFVTTYRPELYRAARAMSDEATGRELADSLYADLFGLSEKDGVRSSLFRYYHGRAKLSTWLRSVLAQRRVDLARTARRLTSLDDPDHAAERTLPAAAPADPARAAVMRMAAAAVTAAVAALEPPDRFRLACYYVHEMTLAQIGRLAGEHEATVSRKLERARKTLRAAIEAALSERGVALADVDSWADVAREAWDAALADALGVESQGPGVPPFEEKRMP